MADESKALARQTQGGMSVMEIAAAAVKSQFFPDLKTAEQGVVKILRGRELGIGDMEALEGIHVIKGKTALSAALVGARIKASGRYDYRIVELTEERCEIAFFDGGKELKPHSTFTMADAKKADLVGGNWAKFPRNMLMARALTNGARWHCPDVFGGAVYTPDELKGEIEVEDIPSSGPIIEGEVVKPKETKPSNGREKVINAIHADWQSREEYEPAFANAVRRYNSIKGFFAVQQQSLPQECADKMPSEAIQTWFEVADEKDIKAYGQHNRGKLVQAKEEAKAA